MRLGWVALVLAAALCATPAWAQEEEEEGDPAEVGIGERLFLETRFAQFFAENGTGVNVPLATGDPVVATIRTLDGVIPGPFAGQSINCRSCHFVDDLKGVPGGGNRSYADFARRSPIPAREDGQLTTPRNVPSLVNASLQRGRPFFLHFDGEFPTSAALVRGTLTGRNYGWLPAEGAAAVAHIARVVREDDGTGALAADFGGSYRRVLAGTDPSLPKELRLTRKFRIDVTQASDDEIVTAVSRLIAAYVESLVFAQEDEAFSGSPYDRFLVKNHIPAKPDEFESPKFYLARLRTYLATKDEFEFVADTEDGPFALHAHPFVFGPLELEGLRIFTDPDRGNCTACHPPPTFTDFGFHNTGVSELEYDRVHGPDAFKALAIPSQAARDADPDAFLPATAAHPLAREPFRSLIDPATPGRVDLGVWNIYRNGDFASRRQQRRLDQLVCASRGGCRGLSQSARLDAAIGLFKTPGLRDLGHSNPYFHTGNLGTLEAVVNFYIDVSMQARGRGLRNGAKELERMRIDPLDVKPLVAFLKALDEDYE